MWGKGQNIGFLKWYIIVEIAVLILWQVGLVIVLATLHPEENRGAKHQQHGRHRDARLGP